MASEPSGEEEIRRLLAAYQQYEAQAQAIVRELGLVQMTMQGLDAAVKAVEAMESAQEGQDILVPIGSGSFAHAKLASKERVLLNVGAGITIEKNTAEAKESLTARKADVTAGSKKLSDALARVDQEMQKIQAVLSKYEEQAGGAGSEGFVQ
ncbi:MAG TPA: prefoldin subunit alpha [Methanotrichaceae archaeon]|nr:prefoldin subunit alpha [Methanotrichaceae archaeon]